MKDFDNLRQDRQLALLMHSYIIASKQLQKLDFSRTATLENRSYKKDVLMKQHKAELKLLKYVSETYMYDLKSIDLIMLCKAFDKANPQVTD